VLYINIFDDKIILAGNSFISIAGFSECTNDNQCAGECMRTYFRRYGERCAKQLKKEPYELTCADYIRLHDGGPDGCSKRDTLPNAYSLGFCMD